MEKNDLNKSMCEELFGEKSEVTVVSNCFEKSDARWQKNCRYGTLQITMKRICIIEAMVHKMDEFCRMKKTCSCQLERVLLRYCANWSNSAKILSTWGAGPKYLEISWEGLLVGRWNWRGPKVMRASGMRAATAPQIVVSSSPDLCKRPRELTVSPKDTAAKKPEIKRPKASPKEEKWVEVPDRKNLWKKKPKLEAKKSDWPKHVRPEAVPIKPAEGLSYAGI